MIIQYQASLMELQTQTQIYRCVILSRNKGRYWVSSSKTKLDQSTTDTVEYCTAHTFPLCLPYTTMQSANAYSHGFFLKATHTNPCPPSPAPSNSLRTLFSHSLSDTQVLYKVYDIIRLPTTRQADITSCRDRRGASSQHTSHKYTEA